MNPIQRTKLRKRCFSKLADLYQRMDEAYDQTASAAGFHCAGCQHNCCVSHFQHHTMIEWAYFYQGIMALPEGERQRYRSMAQANVDKVQRALGQGQMPAVMCPMNAEGLCQIYHHRFMICRLHGVANTIAPLGRDPRQFPGCPRYEELATGQNLPPMDRTLLYQELAALDSAFRETLPQNHRNARAKVDFTLSEMLLLGPPA